jgi:hypothetical protein
MAGEQLGYAEGYRFLQNPKVLIMNILRISISALWRRYSWFESMGKHQIEDSRKLVRGCRFCYPVSFDYVSIEASDAGRLITISWFGQVDSNEMRRCAEEIHVS